MFSADILACYRVGKFNPRNTKPRPILVKFYNEEARIDLFNARKELKKSKKKYLQKVYINEDMAPMRSPLYYIARGLKDAGLIYRYWVYDSEVWFRKTPTDEPITARGMSAFADYKDTEPYKKLYPH